LPNGIMKSYPSISRSTGQSFRAIPNAVIFEKLDGSLVRVEWMGPKNSWTKFGTKERLLDPSDPVFGIVPVIFRQHWEEPLSRIATDQRWERGVFFFEFWGPNSFAGNHEPEDPKGLTLIDVAIHKRGIMGPRNFLEIFDGKVAVPNLVGVRNWSREFVEEVWRGEVEGASFEGVVGKAGSGHHLIMAKAKTRAWIERLKTVFDPKEAERLANS